MYKFREKKQEQDYQGGNQAYGAPRKENESDGTGLPDAVRRRYEAMSGMSLKDVRVYYQSGQPVRIGALAYARGNQIHLAPGQEQYLGHELGHVIQQKRGVVPTTRIENALPVNDDPALESGADHIRYETAGQAHLSDHGVVQKMKIGRAPSGSMLVQGMINRIWERIQADGSSQAAVEQAIASLTSGFTSGDFVEHWEKEAFKAIFTEEEYTAIHDAYMAAYCVRAAETDLNKMEFPNLQRILADQEQAHLLFAGASIELASEILTTVLSKVQVSVLLFALAPATAFELYLKAFKNNSYQVFAELGNFNSVHRTYFLEQLVAQAAVLKDFSGITESAAFNEICQLLSAAAPASFLAVLESTLSWERDKFIAVSEINTVAFFRRFNAQEFVKLVNLLGRDTAKKLLLQDWILTWIQGEMFSEDEFNGFLEIVPKSEIFAQLAGVAIQNPQRIGKWLYKKAWEQKPNQASLAAWRRLMEVMPGGFDSWFISLWDEEWHIDEMFWEIVLDYVSSHPTINQKIAWNAAMAKDLREYGNDFLRSLLAPQHVHSYKYSDDVYKTLYKKEIISWDLQEAGGGRGKYRLIFLKAGYKYMGIFDTH